MAKPTIDVSWATNNDPLDVIQPPQILKNSGVVTNSVWGREYLNYQFYGLGVWVNWVRLDAMDRQRNLSDLVDVVMARANLGLTATAIADLVQTTGTSTTAVMTQKAVTDSLNTKTDKTTQIIAGTGLTGGGTLAANRTLNVSYGNTAGTAAQGNDSRIVNAAPNSRTITAGVGLTGGGNLTANRTLNVTYGTTAGTAAQGNDSRIVNAVPNSRTITAGTGLTGGGTLAANRTISIANSHIPIGVGQTWQSVNSSRSLSTTYTNTTGRPILVHVQMEGTSGEEYAVLYVGDMIVSRIDPGDKRYHGMLTAIVPNGSTYRVNTEGPTKHGWWELR